VAGIPYVKKWYFASHVICSYYQVRHMFFQTVSFSAVCLSLVQVEAVMFRIPFA